jgi:Fic family protein
MYVRREAVLSSQIEGTRSTLSDLLLFELEEAPGAPFDDVREVSNYVRALEHGIGKMREGLPLCNRLLREMHAILLAGGRGGDMRPGHFRTRQNWIGGVNVAQAAFVPAPPQEVEGCMAALERFINETDDDGQPYESLVKAALAHVQFETIHPFLDGNGRLGRMLISFILHSEGMLSYPLFYLSLYLRQHRERYFGLLMKVRLEGDWEGWLDFFLEGVRDVARNAVITANRLMQVFREDEQRMIDSGGRQAGSLLRVLGALQKRPLGTIPHIARTTGLSYPAASKALSRLEELGIVREITRKRRDRVYAYVQYMDILNSTAISASGPGNV